MADEQEFSLRLGIDASGAVRGSQQAVQAVNKVVAATNQLGEKGPSAFKRMETAVFSLKGALATLAVGAGLKFAVGQIIEAQDAAAQLDAVLKSTGRSATTTATQFKTLASELQKSTRFSDEAILSAETLLLGFDNISAGAIPRATRAILDISTRLNIDLKAAALQVGKALQDPEEGLSALSRAGVKFSDTEKATVKAMKEFKTQADVEAFVLAKLESQFGGAAEAAGDNLGGALAKLQNATSDLGEEVGAGLAPALSDLAKALTDLSNNDEAKRFFNEMGVAVGGVISLVRELTPLLKALAAPLSIIRDTAGKGLSDLLTETGVISGPRLILPAVAPPPKIRPIQFTPDATDPRNVDTSFINLPSQSRFRSGLTAEGVFGGQRTPSVFNATADELRENNDSIRERIALDKEWTRIEKAGQDAWEEFEDAQDAAFREEQSQLQIRIEAEDQIKKDRMEQAQALRLSVEPAEALTAEFEKIDELARDFPDILTPEVVDKAKKELQNVETAGNEMFQDLKTAAEGFGRDFSRSLADALVEGKASFEDFGKGVLKVLAEIAIQRAIVQPLINGVFGAGGSGSGGLIGLLTGAFSGGGGGGQTVTPEFSPPVASARGNMFDRSGVIPFATGGVVTTPRHFRFAGGIGLMGEAGPEAILPLRRGPGGRLGVESGGGGAVTVQVIDQRSGGAPAQVTQGKGPDGRQMIRVLIRDEVSRGLSQGEFDTPLRSNFGIARSGSQR